MSTTTQRIGYYATVQDNAGRSGFLMGPYQSKELAESMVDAAKRRAHEVNSDAHWYAYGTARVVSKSGSIRTGLFGK